MIVCSEIRSRERERVVVDRVRILVEELLEGGTGLWCDCMSVSGEESSAGLQVECAAWNGSVLGEWKQ